MLQAIIDVKGSQWTAWQYLVGAVKDNWKITNRIYNTEIIKLYLRPTPADCKVTLVSFLL